VTNTPKLVAGLTAKSCELAIKFYSNIVREVVQCESLEVAESAKLLENSFRLINISFINEFSIFCEKLGIDTNSVIEAAATKPYGFMPFYPSIGVGGHCIPVDPLSSKAEEIGAPTKFIDLAIQINLLRPSTFVDKAEQVLGELKDKRVLVVGVSYKPNVADVRETPVKELMIALENRGAQVFWHDELVREWNGSKSADLDGNYDLAIIATRHNYLNVDLLKGMPIINSSGSVS
jgi:UDP-N-acetyl-D-glucosamine dehydrogenase